MTGGQTTRSKVGAVFFAFVVVVSMVAIGGFAGTAAANVGSGDIGGITVDNVEVEQSSNVSQITLTGINNDGNSETLRIDSGDLPTDAAFVSAQVASSGFSGSTTATVNGGNLEISLPGEDATADVTVDVTYETVGTPEGTSTLNVDSVDGGQTGIVSGSLEVVDNPVAVRSASTADTNNDGDVDQINIVFNQETGSQPTTNDLALTDGGSFGSISTADDGQTVQLTSLSGLTGTAVTPDVNSDASPATFGDKDDAGDLTVTDGNTITSTTDGAAPSVT